MGHIVFVAVAICISVGWWLVVYSAPWTLSLILPRGGLIFAIGFAVFALGLGSCALSVYGPGSPEQFLGSMLTAFWGGWLMLAPTAARRSSPEDMAMMERLALMLVALMCVLVLSFSAAPEVVAGLQLWLVLLGAVIAMDGLTKSRR